MRAINTRRGTTSLAYGLAFLAALATSPGRAEGEMADGPAVKLRAGAEPQPGSAIPPAIPLPITAPLSVAEREDAGPRDPALPEPPAASVTFTPADRAAGALELRLADGKGLWPARLPKRDREGAVAFYAARAFRPLWTSAEGWTVPARAAIARLEAAGEDGLDPAEYALPRLGSVRPATAVELAEADAKLSAAIALYARDARGGRIDPVRLSPLVTPKLDLPAAGEVLALTAAAADPGDALLAYQPAYPAYRALRAKLAELRAHRPGSPDPAVSRPRERPEAGARMASVSRIAIIDDVPSFDVAPPASTSLSSPRLEGDLIANMERWRWLPAAVAPRYLIVNIPEFRLRIVENGQVTHEARVITGKPETPTPILSSVMDHAIVNPSWYIPPSILKKEILPGLAADPGYAARRGYEVIRRGNQISVRQPPGERNALGFIKFMFPNQHAVYLHDTPTRNLFGSGRRAFSHGCVRVDQPFALADAVLGAEWSETRLKKLIGRGERTIRLERPVPVHIAYFTLEADIAGGLRSFEDIYGYNRRVRQALGLGG